MDDCIFCKILKGEIPCTKIYENDLVLAFLDINPINPGHTLVIPKEHHVSLTTVPDECLAEILKVSTAIGRALVKLKEYDGFNLHQSNGDCAGQVVPHVHMHIVPRVGTDGFSWNWRTLQYSGGEASETAKKIIEKLKI